MRPALFPDSRFEYRPGQWLYAKSITAMAWAAVLLFILFRFNAQPYPEGICRFLPCETLAHPYLRWAVAVLIVGLCLAYVSERYMKYTTLAMAVLGIVLISLERSNGFSHRKEIFSAVIIAQCLAYWFHSFSAPRYRDTNGARNLAMQLSVQTVAAHYVISAISKLLKSGTGWFMDSPNISAQIIRTFHQKSMDTGLDFPVAYGEALATLIIDHPTLTRLLFFAALAVEAFAFLAWFGKDLARKYGFLLILLHVGAFFLLSITLFPFMLMVVAYLINLPDRETVRSGLPSPKNMARLSVYPLAFILLSYLVGEVHPFTLNPMYSSFPPHADYFYLEDCRQLPYKPIAGNELEDLMQVEIDRGKLNRDKNSDLALAAENVSRRLPTNDSCGFSIYRQHIVIVNKKLHEERVLLFRKEPD